MPSFLERMRRFMKGEPVFRPGEDIDNPQQARDKDDWDLPPQAHTPDPQPAPAPVTAGPRITPLVTVERVECHPNGSNMEVTVHIKNHASIEVMIDKIMLLGQTRELDRELRAGEEFEFVNVYNGPRPNNRNYTHCELQYYFQDTNNENNYLSAIHNTEYKQEADGAYTITRLRFIPPVKDI